MTERQIVDCSDVSAVCVCTCGWRAVVNDRGQGWRVAYDHALAAHPGDTTDHARRQAGRWGE
jgi:hypothetical protein